jgi:two-component system NtrC family sensor kinase
MSLSRRMALKTAALILSFTLLSAALFWGLGARVDQANRAGAHAGTPALTSAGGMLIVSALLCVSAALLAGLIVRSQYRDLIRPLRQLREGVRRIAEGDFKERLPLAGAAEFSQLAANVNGMAEEIDSLQADLECRALARSRELIRSERLTSVGFLAAGVAHEINNPLNIITGYAELSLRQTQRLSDPKALANIREALEIIREEGFRCKTITEKLLLLTNTDARSRQAVSLARLAQDVVAMVQGLTQYEGRQVRLALGGGHPLTVWGDENELRQVVLNLVVNALEAVPPGTGQVVLAGVRRSQWVELSVTDNGRGMTHQVIEHAFEPFFSNRGPGDDRGTGLGLTIAHAIMEAHGGRITAESDGPASGSRFTLHLPAYENSNAQAGCPPVRTLASTRPGW